MAAVHTLSDAPFACLLACSTIREPRSGSGGPSARCRNLDCAQRHLSSLNVGRVHCSQMQAGEPGSKLLHENIYSRVWEQDTPSGSFLGEPALSDQESGHIRTTLNCRRVWVVPCRDCSADRQRPAAAAAHCKRAQRTYHHSVVCAWRTEFGALVRSFRVSSIPICCSAR